MNVNPEPTPEEEASSEMPPVSRRKRAGGRASMRDEFLALFRDTRLGPPSDESAFRNETAALDGAAPREGPAILPASEPSRFLRRFLQQAAPSPELAPSGLAGLDGRLGGGFGSGLHLVLGPPGSGKTAFLESLAWEAVASQRPSLYYALKTGSLRVWERLIATLGTILDGPAITPSELRGQELGPKDMETLGRLDAALQASVLPYLALIDGTPASAGSLSTFVEDIRSRAQEAGEQHGWIPLVLVDDLERLVALTGSRSPLHVLSRLDNALAADSIPGLLACAPDGLIPTEVERLAVQTVVSLTPILPLATATPERVDLEVRKNAATGWTGILSLLLDPWSGLFAESGAGE
jgi:hypothetical protein